MTSNQHTHCNRFLYKFTIPVILALLSACTDDGDGFKFVEAIESSKLGITDIRIETDNPVINAGENSQYRAYGIPSDPAASESDITKKVRWMVADETLASISDTGLLTAKMDGDVNVRAEFADFSANFVQTINTANLLGLTISGVNDVDECRNLQLTALGDYDDGTTRLITDQVTWSTTAAEATIDSTGLLRTFSAASVDVTAEASGVSGTATVNVTDSLQQITLSPLTPALETGEDVIFSATGSYASGTEDITDNTTWTSADTSIASFVDETLTGVATGTVIVTAACGGVTAETTASVTQALQLQFVEINNGVSSVTVNESDGTVQLELTANYSDGSEVNVTADATWSIDSESGTSLEISNSSGSEGEVTINLGTGSATIRADYENEFDLINIIVE